VKKVLKCTNVESNSLCRREEATAIVCVRAQMPFPSLLDFSYPCTDGCIGRKHWQYTFTEHVNCQTQRGSGVMRGHRKTVCMGKITTQKNPFFSNVSYLFPRLSILLFPLSIIVNISTRERNI